MKNAELLESLAAVAREEDPARDPKWKALLEGRLSGDEVAALEHEARHSEKLRQLFDAYRPLDEATRARIAEQALARLAPSEISVDETPILHAPPPRQSSSSAPTPLPRASVSAPSPSSSSGRFGPPRLIALFGGVLLALALWRVIPQFVGPALPHTAQWTMTIDAEQSQRGTAIPGELPHLGPGSTFTAALRPEVHVDGPLAARAFLARDGRVRAWEVPIELVPGGAARITGTKEALFPGVGAGRWEVLVVVGLPAALPEVEQVSAIAALPAEQRAGKKLPYRLYGREIELRDSRGP